MSRIRFTAAGMVVVFVSMGLPACATKDGSEIQTAKDTDGEGEARQVKKIFEGEEMRIVAKSAKLAPQHLGSGYSNERHLWWQHAKVGDKIVLGFELVRGGRYEIVGHFVKAMDYGIHQLSINGAPLGEPIDFYDPGVVPSGEMALGTADLRAGENLLEVKCTGTNPAADPVYYMFGIDYIRIEPVR